MRSLNCLKWLHAFEAAARHGSFTGAAEELGVTPAAVGQLVRSLEEWVGHPLLHRTRSGKERLSLVAEAKEALQDITAGLDSLEQGLNKLRGARARAVVVITASQVLMMNWLMERLNRFSEQHDSIDLRLNVTEKLTDVLHGEADVGIRCGPGNWPGLQSTWLMDEEAVIVCSPQLLGGVTEADCLSKQKLIFDDTPHPGADFPTWERILANIGVPASQQNGLHINSTSAVILAALSGRGVAVVRKALVQQLIEHGQLRQLFPQHKWPLRWSYFIVRSERSTRRQEVSLFHDWLVADVGATIK
ncbi:LysR substrate-binding domain-containing protein [Cedecea davisae]|uniref:LysR substrate-binding domain-containing protein n=1 Tax=Cedecea davisae TaxID=158484 RepID=UPI00376EC6EF